MEITTRDKRPLYIFLTVILAHVGIYFYFIFHFALPQIESGNLEPTFLPEKGLLWCGVISFVISIIAVLVSRMKDIKKRNLYLKSIYILMFLALLWAVNDYFTCTGKFCEFAGLAVGVISALSAAIFTIFYLVGLYFSRWKSTCILSLIFIEIIAIAFLLTNILSVFAQ